MTGFTLERYDDSFRCKECRKHGRILSMQGMCSLPIVKFCPFCGSSKDIEVKRTVKDDEPMIGYGIKPN